MRNQIISILTARRSRKQIGARPVSGRCGLAVWSSSGNPGVSLQAGVLRAGTTRAPRVSRPARILTYFSTVFALTHGELSAQTNLPSLITEHVDIRIHYTAEGTNNLSFVIRDTDHAVDYQTNEIVLVALESSEMILPAGTPYGNEGDSLWVLPQDRQPGQEVLSLGFAAGAAGIFADGRVTVRLKRVEGPGNFFLVQSGSFGTEIKMSTADGLDESDKLEILTSGHDHYNWAFTTSGVYCITFQASGTRVGETEPIFSPETTIVFHIRPLGVVTPYALWQKAHWLQGTDDTISGPGSDPDQDGLVNAFEYASYLDPNAVSTNGLPAFAWLTVGSDTFGAFTFTRVKAASDLNYEPAARSQLSSGVWEAMTHEVSVIDHGATATFTLRDTVPMSSATSRFYQFRVKLHEP